MICNKCHNGLPEDSEFCQYCGAKIEEGATSSPPQHIERAENTETEIGVLMASFSLTVVSIAMIFIVLAMNFQDISRNQFENWNPTVVYVVLLFALGVFAFCVIFALRRRSFSTLPIVALAPIVVSVIAVQEGSVLAEVCQHKEYINGEMVTNLNIVWMACIGLAFLSTLIPICLRVVKETHRKWYSSVPYREMCYRRVARAHTYLEKGILTEEEFNNLKKDILKHIEW